MYFYDLNTYVNDVLFDYSIVEKKGDQYTGEITNYISISFAFTKIV